MLAAALEDVPVVVDADRYRGGMNVMRSLPVDVFLMDDGFQHLALYRDWNIVLLPEGEDPERMSCLPKGPLREPASALRVADMVVRFGKTAVRSVSSKDTPSLPTEDRNERGGWSARMEPGDLHVLGETDPMDRISLQGERIFAFCGIARPRSFWNTLERAGLKVEESLAYPDHHRYTPRDHQELTDRMNRFDRAITTEKDAVKLTRFPWPPGKLLVLGLRPVLAGEPEFWNTLETGVPRLRR
jgi:tetraacyldisaccharide 4'-kinase